MIRCKHERYKLEDVIDEILYFECLKCKAILCKRFKLYKRFKFRKKELYYLLEEIIKIKKEIIEIKGEFNNE